MKERMFGLLTYLCEEMNVRFVISGRERVQCQWKRGRKRNLGREGSEVYTSTSKLSIHLSHTVKSYSLSALGNLGAAQ